MANSKPEQKQTVTGAILKDLVESEQINFKLHNPTLAAQKSDQPANLYQDAGGGYNTNFVFPQE